MNLFHCHIDGAKMKKVKEKDIVGEVHKLVCTRDSSHVRSWTHVEPQ